MLFITFFLALALASSSSSSSSSSSNGAPCDVDLHVNARGWDDGPERLYKNWRESTALYYWGLAVNSPYSTVDTFSVPDNTTWHVEVIEAPVFQEFFFEPTNEFEDYDLLAATDFAAYGRSFVSPVESARIQVLKQNAEGGFDLIWSSDGEAGPSSSSSSSSSSVAPAATVTTEFAQLLRGYDSSYHDLGARPLYTVRAKVNGELELAPGQYFVSLNAASKAGAQLWLPTLDSFEEPQPSMWQINELDGSIYEYDFSDMPFVVRGCGVPASASSTSSLAAHAVSKSLKAKKKGGLFSKVGDGDDAVASSKASDNPDYEAVDSAAADAAKPAAKAAMAAAKKRAAAATSGSSEYTCGLLWQNNEDELPTPRSGPLFYDQMIETTGFFGDGINAAIGQALLDDFVVGPHGWSVQSVKFLYYQTFATAPLSIKGASARIYTFDSPADDGLDEAPVASRVLSARRAINAFRTAATDAGKALVANRFVYEVTVEFPAGTWLPQGRYWVEMDVDGNRDFSGPWSPPVGFGNGWQTSDNGEVRTLRGLEYAFEVHGCGVPHAGPKGKDVIEVDPEKPTRVEKQCGWGV